MCMPFPSPPKERRSHGAWAIGTAPMRANSAVRSRVGLTTERTRWRSNGVSKWASWKYIAAIITLSPAFFMMIVSALGAERRHVVTIAAYAGKYPFDVVGGFKFLIDPRIREAVSGASYNVDVKKWALSEGTSSPIQRFDDLIVSASCEPHNCADHNWAIVLRLPRGPASICYHDADLMDKSSRWFFGGRPKFTSPLDCESGRVPAVIAACLGDPTKPVGAPCG